MFARARSPLVATVAAVAALASAAALQRLAAADLVESRALLVHRDGLGATRQARGTERQEPRSEGTTLGVVDRAARFAGVRLRAIGRAERAAPEAGDLSVEVTGSYSEVVRFLEDLESNGGTRVLTLSMAKNDGSDDSGVRATMAFEMLDGPTKSGRQP